MFLRPAFSFTVLFSIVIFLLTFLSGCGDEATDVVNGPTQLNVSNNIIPESVKVEKNGDSVTINYQTSSSVKKAYVVTSDFSFNGVPLWSDFHETKSDDGLKHAVTFSSSKTKNYMIYADSNDKYDNGGKGFKIE